MRIRVCSGWNDRGSILYGQRFISTFDKLWPNSIELQVYTETPEPLARNACRSLWDCSGAREFIERHRNNLAVHGREQLPGQRWKRNAITSGYNFKFDGFKFFRQIIVPKNAAQDMVDGDILVWLDGDVVTTKQVPENFIPDLIGDADISYLGRVRSHSEIGYWSVRINDRTRMFLNEIADMYMSDRFLKLTEWHSAFVHDTVRQSMKLRERNLTPKGRGHVWLQSPLFKYTDHLKGDVRKRRGRSI